MIFKILKVFHDSFIIYDFSLKCLLLKRTNDYTHTYIYIDMQLHRDNIYIAHHLL